MSLNNHECEHNKFTGPVEITPGDLEFTDINYKYNTTNTNIWLPGTEDHNLETDINGNIPISSEILLTGYTDLFRLKLVSCKDKGYGEIATADNGNEPIYVRQYNSTHDENNKVSTFDVPARTLTLLDASGNTIIPGNLTVEGGITVNGSLRVKGNIIKVDSNGKETIL